MITYKAKDFSHLVGINGFSKKLLENHFHFYEGYVKNANLMLENLKQMTEKGAVETPEFSEVKRRLGYELNGIKLHEYYFGNMTKLEGIFEVREDFKSFGRIINDFGSYERWREDIAQTALTRGVGWAILIHDPETDTLMNTWVDEHHIGHVAGCTSLLVIDLWEHAMLLDYGSDRKKYLKAFFDVIDWEAVEERFEISYLKRSKEYQTR